MEDVILFTYRNSIGIKSFFRIIAALFVLFSSINFSSSIIESNAESFRFFTMGSISLSSLTNNSDFKSSGSLVPSPVLFVLVINLSVLVSASFNFFSLLCSKFGLDLCRSDIWVAFCWYFQLSKISSLVRFFIGTFSWGSKQILLHALFDF